MYGVRYSLCANNLEFCFQMLLYLVLCIVLNTIDILLCRYSIVKIHFYCFVSFFQETSTINLYFFYFCIFLFLLNFSATTFYTIQHFFLFFSRTFSFHHHNFSLISKFKTHAWYCCVMLWKFSTSLTAICIKCP